MLAAQHHGLHALCRAAGLDIQHVRAERQRTVRSREHGDLGLLVHRMEERDRGRLARVRARQAAAVGLGLKGFERKARRLAVLEHDDHIPLVVARQQRIDRRFALVHAQLGG